MRLGQLAHMGLGELSGRSRQHAFKWIDRVGPVEPRRVSVDVASLDPRRALGAGCVSTGAHERQDPGITPGSADACARIIDRADRVCAGRFDLLGYRDLSFGIPIDWHLDAVSGRRSPLVHWSRLDPLDGAVVGDSKVVWELNRHQWLVHLGEAYCLTGDERYAAVFADRVHAWTAANPHGMGINWASSLEAALRLIAWCWSLELFRHSTALTPALAAEMSRSIASHASHVEKYLSYYFSPNTHLTGEALGLFYAGAVLDGHPRSSRWRELATRILIQESERQVHRDGVYFEQSTYYQRYTVEIYLHFLVLAARVGVPVPESVAARVQSMLDFLLSVRRPDGSLPQIGDSDGGWILPFELRGAEDVRGVFATAAALFTRPDYAWAAGAPTLETYWLLGEEGLAAFAALAPATPQRPVSRAFREGGYVVMRNGWATNDHQLIFDVGALGCPNSSGHGHADLLSVQCAAFGEPYLADAGTGSYSADEPWRNFFRSSAAHSTIAIDGIGQAIPAGPFAWQARPRARLKDWVSTESYDLADAEHDAYITLPDPVIHRRRVLFVKPRYWVVIDDLAGQAEHRVDLGFQFAPIDLTVDVDPWVRAQRTSGRGLAVGAWSTATLDRSIVAGGVDPLRGWHSAEYGRREAAPFVAYSVVARFPIRLVSAIVPLDHVSASLPTLRELLSCVALLES